MAATPPVLGYNQRAAAPIDAVNQWMRTQPWYTQTLKSFGQDPSNVHLSDNQKQALVRAAQANGVVVDEGGDGQEIDDSGNFQAKGHKLRNTLIVAGIAAAALATAGVALSAAPAAAGGAAAAGGGTLAASATAPLVGSLAAGGTGLAAAGGGAAVAGASAVPWGTIIGAGTNLFGSLFGAHEQANAAAENADKQVAASKYAADLQDAASKRSEALLRQQSENDYQNQEVSRKGNYDQYRAQRSRLGTLGAMLGLPAPEIPDYVPSVDPRFTDSGTTAPPAAAGAPPSAGGADAVTQALLDNYKQLGVAPTGPGSGPTDIAYFTQKAKEALAAGERPLSYWLGPNGRVAQEIAQAKKGGAAPTAAAPIVPRGTLATAIQPYQVANPTAPLTPYGTLARMAG